MTQIKNKIAHLFVNLEVGQTDKKELLEQLENAKTELAKPFAFEEELKEKIDRLNALNIELNLNEKDTSALDSEPEQSEKQPERISTDRER